MSSDFLTLHTSRHERILLARRRPSFRPIGVNSLVAPAKRLTKA